MKFIDYLKTYHTNIRQELGELQEVEEIGILQPLLRQIRLRWRQRDGEVADRLALPVEEIAFNPHGVTVRHQARSSVLAAYQHRQEKTTQIRSMLLKTTFFDNAL